MNGYAANPVDVRVELARAARCMSSRPSVRWLPVDDTTAVGVVRVVALVLVGVVDELLACPLDVVASVECWIGCVGVVANDCIWLETVVGAMGVAELIGRAPVAGVSA